MADKTFRLHIVASWVEESTDANGTKSITVSISAPTISIPIMVNAPSIEEAAARAGATFTKMIVRAPMIYAQRYVLAWRDLGDEGASIRRRLRRKAASVRLKMVSGPHVSLATCVREELIMGRGDPRAR